MALSRSAQAFSGKVDSVWLQEANRFLDWQLTPAPIWQQHKVPVGGKEVFPDNKNVSKAAKRHFHLAKTDIFTVCV